ncbi:hypothetical protein NliqN6_0181 [Naganishia liquefaciens]|uniref:Uncharacterized protein n=1 Tax=Naganishia liquefaciens TaxID=104408 RepID=A0A8H3TP62_9TREE|nr:hypothetical protein NliqN6_0181 [Naganishia liquefaciens]
MNAVTEAAPEPKAAEPVAQAQTPHEGNKAEGPADAPKEPEPAKDKPVETNAVPKPQHATPGLKRRAEVVYDSQSEIPGRCEDWLLIPVKKYPLINWRFLFGGTGQTLSPLTLIERETGAAILVRNMKRTMNRRPTGGLGGLMAGAGFAEVQRFQEALAALQKAERDAAAMAANEGNVGGGAGATAARGSNAAFPPTPKDDIPEGAKNRQLPEGGGPTRSPPNVNIKLADAAVTTPAPSSPTQAEPKVTVDTDAHKAHDQKPGNLPALKEEEELKEKQDQKQPHVAADPKKENEVRMEIDKPLVPETSVEPEVIDPRTAPENKDIGLHCWIVGILQSEVDHAYAKIQDLIHHAINEYEVWQEEHGNQSEEEHGEVKETEKDTDVTMESGQAVGHDSEAKNTVVVKL